MSSINLSAVWKHIMRHAAAYALAFLMGTISVAPYAYFALTTPGYAGIAMMGQDAEEHYLARMQEAYEGKPLLNNVFIPTKDTPYLSPGLGEALIAGIAKLTGLRVNDVNVTAKFFLPTVIFLLIYGFGLAVSRSRLAALTGTTLGMLAVDIMSNSRELFSLFQGSSLADGIMWARPINPEMSGILLFGGLWLLYRAYVRREQVSWLLVAGTGVIIGLSLYLSPYVWSFLGVLLFTLFACELVRKNFAGALKLFYTGACALVLAIPFVLNHLAARIQTGYDFASQFAGMMTSHLPSFGIWIAVLLVLPFVTWRTLASSRLFLILCGVSLFIALNQQVVTGIYLQPGHYHWYITKPLVGILIGLYGTLLLIRLAGTRIATAICSIGIVMLFVHGSLVQHNFYINHEPEAREAQSYAPLFSYLNGKRAESIYANSVLSNYLAIYTQNDVPGSWYAGFYLLPIDYLRDRLFLEYRLRSISADQSLAVLKAERHDIEMQLYGGNWSGLPNETRPLPDSFLEDISAAYSPYAQMPLSELMYKLRITYVLEETTEDDWGPREQGLVPENINGRFVLYHVR